MTDQDQGDIFIDAKMSEYNASSNELLRAFMKELSSKWTVRNIYRTLHMHVYRYMFI
jgi:2C-methyl-D-erythritol 2,4-cyclodiphosphate synthase